MHFRNLPLVNATSILVIHWQQSGTLEKVFNTISLPVSKLAEKDKLSPGLMVPRFEGDAQEAMAISIACTSAKQHFDPKKDL